MVDEVVQVTSIHVIFGFIAGILSAMISCGTFGFKNEVFSTLLGFVILYVIGTLCQKKYSDHIDGFKKWFMDGILPFVFTWFIIWVLLFNYSNFVSFL